MQMTRVKVLIADDDALTREIVAAIVGNDGHTVATASDGRELLEKYHSKEAAFNLIISDMHMPGLDALGVIRRLRSDGDDVPVIVLTGDYDISTALEVMQAGADDYVLKGEHLESTIRISIAKTLEKYRYRSMNKELAAELESTVMDLAAKNEELLKTNKSLNDANKKILNSIHYAKMIQGSLLPDGSALVRHLPNSFFIWMPKDIVGGDIYFTEILQNSYIIAIVDCTGHGVPGALMTMIASYALRQITNEDRCYEPGAILKRLNHTVKSMLLTGAEDRLFDVGMDAAVCLVKPTEGILEFAGARMPLYCVNNGTVEVLKGDKQSLGYKDSSSDFDFTTIGIELSRGKSFYLATDGYTDQLGGGSRVPFGNRRFVDLLQNICETPFGEQRKTLLRVFNEHVGDNDVLDDVTVVGFNTAGYQQSTPVG